MQSRWICPFTLFADLIRIANFEFCLEPRIAANSLALTSHSGWVWLAIRRLYSNFCSKRHERRRSPLPDIPRICFICFHLTAECILQFGRAIENRLGRFCSTRTLRILIVTAFGNQNTGENDYMKAFFEEDVRKVFCCIRTNNLPLHYSYLSNVSWIFLFIQRNNIFPRKSRAI